MAMLSQKIADMYEIASKAGPLERKIFVAWRLEDLRIQFGYEPVALALKEWEATHEPG